MKRDQDEFQGFGVTAVVTEANDAIEEALTTAEAVVAKTHEQVTQEVSEDGELSASRSLKQAIKDAERRLPNVAERADVVGSGLPEMLDSLDIKAELGRPEGIVQTSFGAVGGEDNAAVFDSAVGEWSSEARLKGGLGPADIREEGTDGELFFKDDVEEITHVITPSRGVEKLDGPQAIENQNRKERFFKDGAMGEIAEDPVWALLYSIYEERFSGALVLKDQDVERWLFFKDGEALMASSSARQDRLVELLNREGRLEDTDYIEACTAVGSTRRRAGAILVERGLISKREQVSLVRYHYETIILDSCSWTTGTWKVLIDETPGAERILLNVPTPTLVLEGIRSHAPVEDIDAIVLGSAIPVVVMDGICDLGDTGLSFDEKDLYRAADGERTFEELAQQFELPLMEVRRFFAGLKVLDLIRFVDAPKQQRPDSDEAREVQSQDVAASTAPLPAHGVDTEKMRVEEKIAQAAEGSYFELLEVSLDASEYDIEQAFLALVDEFDRTRFQTDQAEDLLPKIELIHAVLEEAYEVLRDPQLCDQYRRVALEDRNR